MHWIIPFMIRETVREIVVPIVCASIAGWAMVSAAKVTSNPKKDYNG